jgi:hypothetical protein
MKKGRKQKLFPLGLNNHLDEKGETAFFKAKVLFRVLFISK